MGDRNQQLARNLSFGTIEPRERLVRRFRNYTDAGPWAWSAADADAFFAEARAVKHVSHATLLGYQTTLRQFCDYITDPHYGWPDECQNRFGTHPIQVCTEWNTGRHGQEALGRPGKRALTPPEESPGRAAPAGHRLRCKSSFPARRRNPTVAGQRSEPRAR